MNRYQALPRALPTVLVFVGARGEPGNDANNYLLSVSKNDTWDKKLGSVLTERRLMYNTKRVFMSGAMQVHTLHSIVHEYEQGGKTLLI